MRRHIQSGFTLIEIMLVLMVLVLLALMAMPAIFDRLQTAKVEASVMQARSVLQSCDIARRRVVSSVTTANRRVINTYNTLPNWSTTTALQGQLAGNQRLPLKNRFGKDILVRYDSERCYVAVDLDFLLDNYGGHETQVVGGSTRIIVTSRSRAAGSTDWIGHEKRLLHNETYR